MGDPDITMEDLEKVHNYIEQCLIKYMTKKETKEALFTQCNIEPWFTDFVWKRLEDENQEFFKEYYRMMALKDIKLKMPAKNTGPAYMYPLVQTDVAFRGLSLDGGGSSRESPANPTDVEMSGYSSYAASAHNNYTPSPSAIYNPSLPSSSRMGLDSGGSRRESLANPTDVEMSGYLQYAAGAHNNYTPSPSATHIYPSLPSSSRMGLDSGGSRRESLANPTDVEMSGYFQYAAGAHNNYTPSPSATCIYPSLPSSSRMGLDSGGSRRESLANPTDVEMSGYLQYAAGAHNNATPSPSSIYVDPSLPSSSRMGSNSQYVNERPDRCSLIGGRRGDNGEEQLVRYCERGTHLAAITVEDSQQGQQLVNSRERGAPIPTSAVANLQQSQQLINNPEHDAPIPASAAASLQPSSPPDSSSRTTSEA